MSRIEASDLDRRQRMAVAIWVIGLVVALILGAHERHRVEGVGYGFPPAGSAARTPAPEPLTRRGPPDADRALIADHVRQVVAEAREFAALSLSGP